MMEYQLKISGVHYGANGDSVAGQKDTEEMHMRTLEMLSWIDRERPIVVLSADPVNHIHKDAIKAGALGKRIGRVAYEDVDRAWDLLRQSGKPMMLAKVKEVAIQEHGYVVVTVSADELKTGQSASAEEIEWCEWMSDLPLLPPSEQLQAEQEAEFVLDNVYLPCLADHDIKDVKTYLDIWVEGSRHDLSREAQCKRSAYIRFLEGSTDKDVRQLADPLKEQRRRICERAFLDEHATVWWKERMASGDVQRLWRQWLLKNDGKLWQGLKMTDSILRQLPANLYGDIGQLDVVLSRLYYLDTPRQVFQAILALLMLRNLTCCQLGIDMRPMTEDEYQQDGVITNPMDMPTTIGRVKEFERTQCSLPIQQQAIQALCYWLREDYEKGAAVKRETSLDNIFHHALNLTRVKMAICDIIAEKGDQDKQSLSVKQTFILHKVLEEIDWLDDDTDTTFIQWFDDVFKWPWKTRDFKSVLAPFKHSLSTTWDENTVNDPGTGREYRQFADYVREQFVDIGQDGTINDKVAFMNLGTDGKPMYIGHGLKRNL